MDRQAKADLVDQLRATFDASGLVIVTHQTGMTVAESYQLRTQIRNAGAGFRVTKNRITRLALQGTQYEGIADFFTGPTAITYAADPVSAAKVVVGYAKKTDKMSIVGAGLGAQVLDTAAVEALATMPSIEELRARLLGVITAPATRLATVMQAPAADVVRILPAAGTQLARVVQAYAAKDAA